MSLLTDLFAIVGAVKSDVGLDLDVQLGLGVAWAPEITFQEENLPHPSQQFINDGMA